MDYLNNHKQASNDEERAAEGKTQLDDTIDFGGNTGAPMSADCLGLVMVVLVPGGGNADTVPAMLTPGEFVMSRGAVRRVWNRIYASMNAVGGGTNT